MTNIYENHDDDQDEMIESTVITIINIEEVPGIRTEPEESHLL